MRTLAVDYGTRRIGLALSDEGGRFATPLDVLTVTDPEQAVEPIGQCARREAVETLLVGLPLNMDGTIGPSARSAVAFGRALARRLSLPVLFVDERLSSFGAEQSLVSRKRGGEHLTRKGKKQRLDALAAASFLQEFLDGQLKPLAVDKPDQQGAE